MTLTSVLYAFARMAIAVCVGFIIAWGVRWMKVPDEPARYIMIIVWVIVGVFCLVQLLALGGLY